jgi:hypothetical protein
MIDDSETGSWATALAPDHRTLRTLSDAELHGPFIIEKIAQWHGCTLAQARDAKGEELRRRTQTTERPE